MRGIEELLRRQAEWQRAQSQRSWVEKVRMAEAVRESVARLRLSNRGQDGESGASSGGGLKPH